MTMTLNSRFDYPTCPTCGTPGLSQPDCGPYWVCPNCDLMFQSPLPVKKYEADEEKGMDGRSTGHLMMTEADKQATAGLARLFALNWVGKLDRGFRPMHRVLDVGAKYPYFASILRKEFHIQAFGLEGMDFDQPNGEPIAPVYQHDLQVPMIAADFEEVNASDLLAEAGGERFDAITMIHVFEHLYRPVDAIRKVYELLQPQGLFFIRVPSHDCPDFQQHMNERQYSVHPYFYSEKSLRLVFRLAPSAGFPPLFDLVETYSLPGGVRDFIFKKTEVLTSLSATVGLEEVDKAKK